jgi:hypothetical protein
MIDIGGSSCEQVPVSSTAERVNEQSAIGPASTRIRRTGSEFSPTREQSSCASHDVMPGACRLMIPPRPAR